MGQRWEFPLPVAEIQKEGQHSACIAWISGVVFCYQQRRKQKCLQGLLLRIFLNNFSDASDTDVWQQVSYHHWQNIHLLTLPVNAKCPLCWGFCQIVKCSFRNMLPNTLLLSLAKMAASPRVCFYFGCLLSVSLDFSSAAAPNLNCNQPDFLFLISQALSKHIWFRILCGFFPQGQYNPKMGPSTHAVKLLWRRTWSKQASSVNCSY